MTSSLPLPKSQPQDVAAPSIVCSPAQEEPEMCVIVCVGIAPSGQGDAQVTTHVARLDATAMGDA